jgi:putative SOS response-associated peptidase YedK
MPVILKSKDFDQWLDPTSEDAGGLMPLLAKCPWPDIEVVPANPITNSPRHDGPDCLTPPDTPLAAEPKAPTTPKRAKK